jgi:hypothetical protein
LREQVERDHHDLRGFALEFVLQHREVCGAVGGRDHDLAVDEGGTGIDQERIAGDLLEPAGPVVAAASENRGALVGDVELDAVAVELDLMDPPLAFRHLVNRRRQGRLDEAGEGRLDADRWRFSALECHYSTHAIEPGQVRPGTISEPQVRAAVPWPVFEFYLVESGRLERAHPHVKGIFRPSINTRNDERRELVPTVTPV